MQEVKLPMIIAVDFDGTLVDDQFPAIGKPNTFLIECMKKCQEAGAKLILWTCRTDEAYTEAVRFCRLKGLVFDAYNENLPEVKAKFGGDPRKIYADVYLDDKASHPADYIKSVLERIVGNAPGKHDNEQHNKVHQ